MVYNIVFTWLYPRFFFDVKGKRGERMQMHPDSHFVSLVRKLISNDSSELPLRYDH